MFKGMRFLVFLAKLLGWENYEGSGDKKYLMVSFRKKI